MSATHCDAWRAGSQGELSQVDSDAATTPSGPAAEGSCARSPQLGAAHPVANPTSDVLGGPNPTVALALVTLFPDLTPTALQHMLGLG